MYLMKFFERLQEEANELVAAAGQRGLTEKANAVTTARNNLHAALQSATQSLQSLQTAQR
jgi:vacuolar-type H+-ATPase subunit E/Vma4